MNRNQVELLSIISFSLCTFIILFLSIAWDTAQAIDTIPVSYPNEIEYNPINQSMYVTQYGTDDYGPDAVAVVDAKTNTVIDSIPVGDVCLNILKIVLIVNC